MYTCDICGKSVNYLETMVIYRRSFDYCLKCRKEVEKIREEFKKEIDYQYVLLDAGLRAGEERIFSGIKNRKKKKIEGGTNDITKNNKR